MYYITEAMIDVESNDSVRAEPAEDAYVLRPPHQHLPALYPFPNCAKDDATRLIVAGIEGTDGRR